MIIETFVDWAGLEMVLIDNQNGSFTSMLKSTYDELLNAPTTFPHLPLGEG